MRRREFIAGLGSAATWSLAARAQPPAIPVISVLNSGIAAAQTKSLAAFRHGLKDAGLVEDQHFVIEFRWAENQIDRLPDLAAEVIARRPAVIVVNTPAALRVRAANTTIPVVFTTGSDPVRDGLVTSLSRPGGNITGVVFITATLGAKRLELLRQFVPKATRIAMLIHPASPEAEHERSDVQAAAQTIGRQVDIVEVGSAGDIELAFATLASRQVDALLVGASSFTNSNQDLIVALAARHAMPAMYATRNFVDAGGLMGYGSSQPDAFHQAGLYTGRILKGEKPGDLPIMQSSKFEFAINLKTAKTLGLEFHPQLLATADEVIE